jgi:hypothetical protein
LYFHLKQGGRLSQRLDKSELLLCRATQFKDLKQLADAILKNSLGSACTFRITHMEGEEIFGSCKQKVNLTPRSKGDSHRHDYVNFSHPCVNHTIIKLSVEIEQPRVDQI